MRKTIFLLTVLCCGLVGSVPQVSAQTGVLRPGDMVEIRLAGVPPEEIASFSAQYQVDDVGMLNLPYINQVRAAGLPTNQVQTTIEQKLRADGIYTTPT